MTVATLRMRSALVPDSATRRDPMTVATVGHGTLSHAALGEMLGEAGVTRLVDVRRYPASRRNPHLGADPLAAALTTIGVTYEWWGDDLGGRRRPRRDSRHRGLTNEAFRGYADHMDTTSFRNALELLAAEASPATALMCAETLWWRCHRRLIADALVVRGIPVVHLLGRGRTENHRLHPAARRGADGWPVYDVGVTGELPGDK